MLDVPEKLLQMMTQAFSGRALKVPPGDLQHEDTAFCLYRSR